MGDRGMVNKKKKKKKDKKSLGYKQRLNLVYSIVFCWLGFLVIRLGWLMWVSGRGLEAKANSEWQREISVTATSGDILDRNESVLVSSANVYRLDFDSDAIRTHIKNKDVTKEEIATQKATEVTEESYDEIQEEINKKNSDRRDST